MLERPAFGAILPLKMGPNLAICVCTRDRAGALERLFERLRAAELDDPALGRVALVVVDNGASDGATPPIRPRLPVPTTVVREPERGISQARNRAVAQARLLGAEHVAFIDDDDLPRPDWLRPLLAEQERSGADLVFGFFRRVVDRDLPHWVRGAPVLRDPTFDARSAYGLPTWAATCNVLIRRRLLDRMADAGSVFDPEFSRIGGGDRDFFIRAVRGGATFSTCRDSVVDKHFEPERLTARGLLRHSFHSGWATMDTAKRHGSPTEVQRLARQSAKRTLLGLAALPGRALARDRLFEQVYFVAGQAGRLYRHAGGRFEFYG